MLAHGFTQNRRCWGGLATHLGEHHEVITVDLPGHGAAHDLVAGPWEAAEHLAATGHRATWLGYSLGARMVLHLALAHPDLVDRLVLVSGTAGIDDAELRARRRAEDEARAAHLEAVGLEPFLDEWLALPLFADLPPELAGVEHRLANTATGLASSLRTCGTGRQDSLWSRLSELRGIPTLVVTGADDAKFTALGRRLVAELGPAARLEVIASAGHAPHLARPDRFSAALDRWLAATR